MECINAMLTRRSVKKYTDKMPTDDQIRTVIDAGLAAASGRNRQAAIIVAITNKQIRDKLSRANAAVMGTATDPFYNAPAVLVVLADKSVNTYIYDGSLVMGNMMLAAHELGLGSCWVHRAKEVFYTAEWKEWLRSLGISGEYEGVGNLILGYPDGEYPAPKERLADRVFFVK